LDSHFCTILVNREYSNTQSEHDAENAQSQNMMHKILDLRVHSLILLVCHWPHSVWTKSLVRKDTVLQGILLFRSVLEDSVNQKSRFPASRPDDVSSHLDVHLSTVPSIQTTCHTVRTPRQTKHHTSGRCGFSSGPFTASRSSCSSLHPSRRLSSSSGRLPVIDQLQIFFPKFK
jgi:hypothetical protein